MNLFELIAPVGSSFRPASSTSRRQSAPIGACMRVDRRQPAKIDVIRGERFACLSGCVWVTVDGDIKDVVLSAGESWIADRAGHLMLTALEPALVSFAN